MSGWDERRRLRTYLGELDGTTHIGAILIRDCGGTRRDAATGEGGAWGPTERAGWEDEEGAWLGLGEWFGACLGLDCDIIWLDRLEAPG